MLALDLNAGGGVLEVNAGSRFVDLLSTTAAALDEFFDQGVIADTELFHACFQGCNFIWGRHQEWIIEEEENSDAGDVFLDRAGDVVSDVGMCFGERRNEPRVGADNVGDHGHFSIASLYAG